MSPIPIRRVTLITPVLWSVPLARKFWCVGAGLRRRYDHPPPADRGYYPLPVVGTQARHTICSGYGVVWACVGQYPTKIVGISESTKIAGNWFNKGGKDRQKNRAKFFTGIADAMATQWG